MTPNDIVDAHIEAINILKAARKKVVSAECIWNIVYSAEQHLDRALKIDLAAWTDYK